MDSYKGFEQERYQSDLMSLKNYFQELIDNDIYRGSCKMYFLKMESDREAAYKTLIGFEDYKGNMIRGFLDIPFWGSVEEGLIYCMNFFKEASIRHPTNTYYPAVVSAAEEALSYLNAGEVQE